MSFKRKTILGITSIMTFLLVMFVFNSLNTLKNSNEKHPNSLEEMSSDLFIMAVKNSIILSDLDSIEEITNGFQQDFETQNLPFKINSIKVTDAKGIVLTERKTELDSRDYVPYNIHKVISKDGINFGSVDMVLLTKKVPNTAVKMGYLEIIIALIVIFFVTMFMFYFLLARDLSENLATFKAALETIKKKGLGHTIEHDHSGAQGEVITAFNEMSACLKDRYDTQTNTMVKQLELAKLAQSNLSQAKAVLNASLDAIVNLDENGNIIEFNPVAETLFGWLSEDIKGRNLNTTLVTQKHRLTIDNAMKQHINHVESSASEDNIRLEGIHKNGHIFPIEISISKLNINKDIIFTAFIRDISSRVASEQNLKLAAVAIESGDPLIITDQSLKILTVNGAYTSLTGYDVQELAETIPDFLTSNNKKSGYYEQLWKQLSSKNSWTGEVTLHKKNGLIFYGRLSISPVTDENQEIIHYVIHLVDISEMKETEAALRESQNKAEKASLAKSHFLANMSHEIRSPLHSIITVNELLLESKLDSFSENLVKTSLQGGKSLMNIINNILDFSKIEAGEMKLKNQRIDLINLVDEVIALSKHQDQDKNLLITSIVDPQLKQFYYGDSVRIKQILTNLVSNAVKFTEEGVVSIHLKSANNKVLIEVEDTGVGLSNEDSNRVFSQFYQADDGNTKQYQGTGLGLAIVKKLVKLMGGNISLKSQLGQGSSFIVSLPLKSDSADIPLQEVFNDRNNISAAIVFTDDEHLKQNINKQLSLFNISLLDMKTLLNSDSKNGSPISVFFAPPYNESSEQSLQLLSTLPNVHFEKIALVDSMSQSILPLKNTMITRLPLPLLPVNLIQALNIEHSDITEANSIANYEIEKRQNLHYKVLIVDDSKTNQMIAENLLAKKSYQFEFADNGLDAVEKALQQKFDLILMDVRMPIMDGIEATKRIRSLSDSSDFLPIIAMTANAFIQDEEACLEAGMNDFLSKPLDIQSLYKKLDYWLHKETPDELVLPADGELENDLEPAFPETVLNKDTLSNLIREVGDQLFPNILDVFIAEMNSRVVRMDENWKANALSALSDDAHALKSSAGSFGLCGLQQLALEIELSSKELNNDKTEVLMTQFPLVTGQALTALKCYLERETG